MESQGKMFAVVIAHRKQEGYILVHLVIHSLFIWGAVLSFGKVSSSHEYNSSESKPVPVQLWCQGRAIKSQHINALMRSFHGLTRAMNVWRETMMKAGFIWIAHPLETSLQGRIWEETWLKKSEVCEQLVESDSGVKGGQAKPGASLSCSRTCTLTLLMSSGHHCNRDGLAKERREGRPHLCRLW